MKWIKNSPGWVLAFMFFVLLILAYGSIKANAEESIHSAYINAPGQLVLTYNVGRFGLISETHTVIYAHKEPILCKAIGGDPRYIVFTQDALVINRKPIKKKSKGCADHLEGKCAVQAKDTMQ